MGRCRCRSGWWLVAAAIGGLYVLGTRERRRTREPALEAIDRPELVAACRTISGLPHHRYSRSLLLKRAVCGMHAARVLDVGSGAGVMAIELAGRPEVAEVTGIDLSGEMVTLARETAERLGANARFLQADVVELPFADASFDLVFSTLSLHHWADAQRGLSEIYRVLAPGGRAVIFDLRRNANAVVLGLAAVVAHYLLPATLRDTEEPLASFHASYTPTELVLMAFKAGWPDPRVFTGAFWQVLKTEKK